jgi:hypothetical protein
MLFQPDIYTYECWDAPNRREAFRKAGILAGRLLTLVL